MRFCITYYYSWKEKLRRIHSRAWTSDQRMKALANWDKCINKQSNWTREENLRRNVLMIYQRTICKIPWHELNNLQHMKSEKSSWRLWGVRWMDVNS